MKGSTTNPVKDQAESEPEMRSNYDFSGGVRGKYYQQYVKSVRIVVNGGRYEEDCAGDRRPDCRRWTRHRRDRHRTQGAAPIDIVT